MHELHEVWERYVQSWNVAAVDEKQRLFDACLSPACVYRDPTTVASGWSALTEAMLAFHRHVPGGRFVTDRFIAHHDRSIACWRMVAGDTTLGEGISYGEYDERRKLVAMTGFFEAPDGSRNA